MSEPQTIPREPPFWPTFAEDDGWPIDRCNECGVIVLFDDLLCHRCLQREIDEGFWDQLGSEERCPRRE
jgi:hypothetical protein